VLPPNDPKLAISLNNVAGVTSRAGRLAEAEAMHREALAIRLKIFDPDHADVTTMVEDVWNPDRQRPASVTAFDRQRAPRRPSTTCTSPRRGTISDADECIAWHRRL